MPTPMLFGPVLFYKCSFDIDLIGLEVLGEQTPCNIKHLGGVKVNVNSQKLIRVLLGKVQRTLIVLSQVKTVLNLGLGVRSLRLRRPYKRNPSLHT